MECYSNELNRLQLVLGKRKKNCLIAKRHYCIAMLRSTTFFHRGKRDNRTKDKKVSVYSICFALHLITLYLDSRSGMLLLSKYRTVVKEKRKKNE